MRRLIWVSSWAILSDDGVGGEVGEVGVGLGGEDAVGVAVGEWEAAATQEVQVSLDPVGGVSESWRMGPLVE